MSDIMSHTGVVVEVSENKAATLEVMREHACVGCTMHGACSIESGGNIRITFKKAYDLQKGDRVRIDIKKRDFFKSMLAVYVMPIFIMLAAALTSDACGASQPVTAFITLASIVLYFLLLKFLHKGRDRQTYVKLPD